MCYDVTLTLLWPIGKKHCVMNIRCLYLKALCTLLYHFGFPSKTPAHKEYIKHDVTYMKMHKSVCAEMLCLSIWMVIHPSKPTELKVDLN